MKRAVNSCSHSVDRGQFCSVLKISGQTFCPGERMHAMGWRTIISHPLDLDIPII